MTEIYQEKFMAPAFSDELVKNTPRKVLYSTIEEYILHVQKTICDSLSQYEKNNFIVDRWKRQDGNGGGISCILQNGKIFERAGVTFSLITGSMSAAGSSQIKKRHTHLKGDILSCFITGVSGVVHHVNPMVPCFHFNVRFFEVKDEDGQSTWWFGGCCDLTPYYIFEEEVLHYHATLKRLCDEHNKSFYPRFKKWCDDYFCIKHRGETRGVGGIFFDDFNHLPLEDCFAFVRSFGDSLLSVYLPFLDKHMNDIYTEKQKKWQLYMRGRHVEFLMLYDRGFHFGINMPLTRIESVMMTLPPDVRFEYGYHPEPGTEEYRTLQLWKNPRDWLQ